MTEVTTNDEKFIGRIVVMGRIRDTKVAYAGLTVELVLWVILNPGTPLISN